MNKRIAGNIQTEHLLLNIEELAQILSVGKNQARKIAEQAEARVVLPSAKTARYSVDKIREYIYSHTY